MVTPFLPFPHSPLAEDWVRLPDSDFGRTLRCLDDLIEFAPHLVDLIRKDQEHHAIKQKAARQKARFVEAQNRERLPGIDAFPVPDRVSALNIGRPRMKPEICLLFLIVRGYLGSIKSRAARDFLAESTTLGRFLASRQCSMPSFSSILENVNLVSQETLNALLDAQIQWIKHRELDTFEHITSDSTACRANCRWPTDSGLILFLAKRVWRLLHGLPKWGLAPVNGGSIPQTIQALHSLNFKMVTATGRKDATSLRKALYAEFLDEAEVLDQVFAEDLSRLNKEAETADLTSSCRERLRKTIESAGDDLALMERLIANATRRVLEGETVPAADKVPSVTDPSAAFIAKGQRDLVVGYRPQISKSRSGFVTAVRVPEGNAADATQVMPLFQETVARTGVIPKVCSWDDGYASTSNRNALLQAGVTTVSFSGSKGKKLTPPDLWTSEPHVEARRMRPAVESVVYQLKKGFGLGGVMRRSIRKVREELTVKVLAFNLYRMQYLLF